MGVMAGFWAASAATVWADAAAEAAVVEFGAPDLIAREFTRAHPARRAARRLLAAGPAVGLCWAVALITSRAWTWPVPAAAAQ